MTQQPCPTCRGEGVLILDPCTVCRGRGRTLGGETVPVKLPRGIDEGYRIRVSGKGNEGPGGNGDLYAHIEMVPHPDLKREAEHLVYVARLPYPRMVLGGKVSVPTLDGPQDMEVKPGTQHGELSRLRGQGLPRLQASGTGDLVVVFEVEVPRPGQLTAEARNSLSDYAAAHRRRDPRAQGWAVRAHREGDSGRVKGLSAVRGQRVRKGKGQDEGSPSPAYLVGCERPDHVTDALESDLLFADC